jgi:hypothetical protein
MFASERVRTVIEQVAIALRQGLGVSHAEVPAAYAEYDAMILQTNQALTTASDLLRGGRREEAINLASGLPVLDCLLEVEAVEQAMHADGQSFAAGWPGKPRLLRQKAVALKAALDVRQRLAPLLRTHRLLALSHGPLKARIENLRSMIELDPGYAGWRDDLVEYERERKATLGQELSSLAKAAATGDVAPDYSIAKAIVKELASADWQEPLESQGIEHAQQLLAAVRERWAGKEMLAIEAALQARGDFAGLGMQGVRERWDAVCRTVPSVIRSPTGARIERRLVGREPVPGDTADRNEHPRRQVRSRLIILAAGGMVMIMAFVVAQMLHSRLWGTVDAGVNGKNVSDTRRDVDSMLALARERIAFINGRITGPVTESIAAFEAADREPARSPPRISELRKVAESLINSLSHDMVALNRINADIRQATGGATPPDVEAALSQVRESRMGAAQRLADAVGRVVRRDDELIRERLTESKLAGSEQGATILLKVRELIDSAELASGTSREPVRNRVRDLEEAWGRERQLKEVATLFDKALERGLDDYVTALEKALSSRQFVTAGARESIAAVVAMAPQYRSAIAWACVAEAWRPPLNVTLREARSWRDAIRLAREMRSKPVGEGAEQRLLDRLDEHLRVLDFGVPEEARSLMAYCETPIMQPGVMQISFDGRIFYAPEDISNDFFVDEESVRTISEKSPFLKSGTREPAAHLAVVAEIREQLVEVMAGRRSVDTLAASLLRMLADQDRVKTLDPILVGRLERDVMELVRRRPLFHDGMIDIAEVAKRLRSTMGGNPRWVRSSAWTDAVTWQRARDHAAAVLPSPETLLRIAESCDRVVAKIEKPLPFCRVVELFGWIDTQDVKPVVRSCVRDREDASGVLLSVEKVDVDTWRFREVGRILAGQPALVAERRWLFGEPLWLAREPRSEAVEEKP